MCQKEGRKKEQKQFSQRFSVNYINYSFCQVFIVLLRVTACNRERKNSKREFFGREQIANPLVGRLNIHKITSVCMLSAPSLLRCLLFSMSHYLLMWQKADALISTCYGKRRRQEGGRSTSLVCVSYCRVPPVRRWDRYRLRRRWASLNAGDSLHKTQLRLIANAKWVWLRRKGFSASKHR